MNAWKQEALSRLAGEYCWQLDDNYKGKNNGAELAALLGYSEERNEDGICGWMEKAIKPETREYIHSELSKQLMSGDEIEMIFPACHRAGHTVWLLNRGCKVVGEDDCQYVVGILVDVTSFKKSYDEQQKMTRTLREMVQRDSLTKLYNARTVRKMAETYLTEVRGNAGCAVLIIDLDDFKQINDQYGHLFGDVVLREAASTIQHLFRSHDVVGRIGGEEFMVLMKDVTDQSIVHTRCRQLNEAFHGIQSGCLQHTLSCSIGVGFAPDHGSTYFDLFRCADQALYVAKNLGKDRYAVYDPDMTLGREGRYAKKFGDYDASVYADLAWTEEESDTEF